MRPSSRSSSKLLRRSAPYRLEEIRRERCERSLAYFIRQSWAIIEPATPYRHNWHIDLLAEYLEAVTAGEITRLLINMPPRYMKSIETTVAWPAWEWTKRPELRYLFASYAASLSTKHSVDRRRIIESDWYRANWPDVELTGDQNLKTEYENTHRGVMVSTSVGGAATGKGGNRVVVDDPVNPQEAYSDAKRQTAEEYFDRTLSTRLDDKRHDAIVVVMQRIHDADLTGHILGGEDAARWVHVKLPAECHERTTVHFPRSGRELVREVGDLLWPEREGAPELAAARGALGSRDYEAQYQQDPAPPEGAMVKDAWWRYWLELPAGLTGWLQSWDMTFTDSEASDFVVGQVWARRAAEKYLVDQIRGQWDFPTTIQMVRAFSAKWSAATLKLVEDKANGPAVIATLRREVGGFVPITPKGGKVARLAAVSPSIEAGNVFIPDPSIAPWVVDYVLEHSRFPVGVHDDQVDATSQALDRLNRPEQVIRTG